MSLESRKGTCVRPPRCCSISARITLPSVDRLLLIALASFSCAPVVAACFWRSLPAAGLRVVRARGSGVCSGFQRAASGACHPQHSAGYQGFGVQSTSPAQPRRPALRSSCRGSWPPPPQSHTRWARPAAALVVDGSPLIRPAAHVHCRRAHATHGGPVTCQAGACSLPLCTRGAAASRRSGHTGQVDQVEARVQVGGQPRGIRARRLDRGAEHAVRAAALPVHGGVAHAPLRLPCRQQLGHILHCRAFFSSAWAAGRTTGSCLMLWGRGAARCPLRGLAVGTQCLTKR